MKKNILSVQGLSACGKTATIATFLDFNKGFRLHSTGAMAREIARKAGMAISEYQIYARTNNIPYDELLDNSLKELADSEENLVIDSRLGYFFIPDSFKVFLTVDSNVAAQRRYEQLQREDPEKYKDLGLEEVKISLEDRNNCDTKKYLELYATDCTNESHYDLIIDTTNLPVHAVATKIDLAFIAWKRNQ